jgi:undecaprenyl pyrophosphate phosphatase UppP
MFPFLLDETSATGNASPSNPLFTIGMIVHDVIFIGTYGMEAVRGITLVSYLVAAAAAFAGAFLAVRLLRMLASSADFTWMSFYCWGIGFFSFVIYLMV